MKKIILTSLLYLISHNIIADEATKEATLAGISDSQEAIDLAVEKSLSGRIPSEKIIAFNAMFNRLGFTPQDKAFINLLEEIKHLDDAKVGQLLNHAEKLNKAGLVFAINLLKTELEDKDITVTNEGYVVPNASYYIQYYLPEALENEEHYSDQDAPNLLSMDTHYLSFYLDEIFDLLEGIREHKIKGKIRDEAEEEHTIERLYHIWHRSEYIDPESLHLMISGIKEYQKANVELLKNEAPDQHFFRGFTGLQLSHFACQYLFKMHSLRIHSASIASIHSSQETSDYYKRMLNIWNTYATDAMIAKSSETIKYVNEDALYKVSN